jgi:hypothetical protein
MKSADQHQKEQERSLEEFKGRLAFGRQAGMRTCFDTDCVAGGSICCTTAGMSMNVCARHPLRWKQVQVTFAKADVARERPPRRMDSGVLQESIRV